MICIHTRSFTGVLNPTAGLKSLTCQFLAVTVTSGHMIVNYQYSSDSTSAYTTSLHGAKAFKLIINAELLKLQTP